MSIKKRNSVTSKKKYNMGGGALFSFKKSPPPKPVQPTYNTISTAPSQPSTSLPYNTVSTAPALETPPPPSENDANNKSEVSKKPGLFAFIINLATILYTTIKSGYDSVVSIIDKTNELLITFDLSKIMDADLRVFLRNKLVELNEISNDPEVQKNLNELAVKLGMYGNVAVGVAFSNVEQLENELINIVIRGTDKITSSLINIVLNAASAIPFVGTAIGAARAFDSAAKMIQTIILTNLEIIEKASNFNEKFINSFIEKINSVKTLKQNNNIKLKGGAVSAIKKANEIKKRLNKSIARFHRTSKVKTRRRHS